MTGSDVVDKIDVVGRREFETGDAAAANAVVGSFDVDRVVVGSVRRSLRD